jgi:nitrate reductase delta subunit
MRRTPMSLTLRVLAHLLSYPDAALRSHLDEMRDALRSERALTAGRLLEIDALVDRLRSPRTLETEAIYVELFDRGRSTALHLFEHVHGDSRDRGPAMIDLIKTYEQAGLQLADGELPDHLSVVLEYASTQPPAQAVAFLREIAHILQVIFSALLRRGSAYASVIAAVLDLAGEKAQAVKLPDEPALDESWEEPPAFGGCSTRGQAAPGQPQPIQITKRPSAPAAATPYPGARA